MDRAEQLSNSESEQVSIPEYAQIAPPTQAEFRLLGSHPDGVRLALRRPRDDGPEPQPNGQPEPPPPPPLPVSTPDLAAQFSPCLPDNLRTGIVNAVRDALAPNADVRTICLNGTQRIGIWLLQSTSGADNQARNRGLERLNTLRSGETFAFFVNSALVRRQATAAWNSAPKRLNGNGQPDSNGPIHLTSFSISFQGPNRVVTRVGGFDERPWPDVDFTITTTDTLSISVGQIQCESVPDLDVDTSWLNALTVLFVALGTILSPVLLLPAAVFVTELIIISSVDTPDADAGAGCAAAALLPREILIPEGLKVVCIYNRVEVSTGGIFAGGSYLVIPRAPSVAINGQRQIATEPTAQITRTYAAAQQDDLRPPLRYAWTADGTVATPTRTSTTVRLNVAGAGPGDVRTRRVALRVTDTDNLTASAETTVNIHVIEIEEDTPPVCRVKPWLPQCQ